MPKFLILTFTHEVVFQQLGHCIPLNVPGPSPLPGQASQFSWVGLRQYPASQASTQTLGIL